jgi:hypothetical protein
MDTEQLTKLLREAEEHHGDYEANSPPHHWSGWYAGYIVAREEGKTEDEAVNDATVRMNALLEKGEAGASA